MNNTEMQKTNKISKLTYAQLNVKQKSLGKESRIIKDDIKKHQRLNDNSVAWSLQDHLLVVVNPEVRATYLAIAYMKGLKYSTVEKHRKPEKEYHFRNYTLKVLLRILRKYHNKDLTMNDLQEWIN